MSMSCPPPMNTDVSGIGVRISFYLQALFLACLSARSGSLDEITGALYTLVATNVAMAVTALILGFKDKPEITLHDAIVVFYLLALSWAAVFFSLPSYNRFVKSDKTLKYLSILQSYVLFAYALAVLIKAKGFGAQVDCNGMAVVVFFRPFNALHTGRIVAWVFVVIIVVVYTVLTVSDYLPLVIDWYKAKKKDRREAAQARKDLEGGVAQSSASSSNDQKTDSKGKSKHGKHKKQSTSQATAYDLGISGNLIIEIIVILILWALTVMNTELLIRWNHFDRGEGTQWQFGQILPLFLVVLPLVNMIKAFRKYQLQRRTHRRKVHKKHNSHQHGRSFGGMGMGMGAGAGHSPFGLGGLGGGRGAASGGMPFMPFFQPSFQQRPDGSNPTARISMHSIHSVHEKRSQNSSDDQLVMPGRDNNGDLYVDDDNSQIEQHVAS